MKKLVAVVSLMLALIIGLNSNVVSIEKQLENATGMDFQTLEVKDGTLIQSPELQVEIGILEDGTVYFDEGNLQDVETTCEIMEVVASIDSVHVNNDMMLGGY